MKGYLSNKRVIAMGLIICFTLFSTVFSPAYATLITTNKVMELGEGDFAREKVRLFLGREDVASQLNAWGVDQTLALSRVNALTDQEIIDLSNKIDEMPAGGDAFSTILVVALFTFVVLLITDITGYTDVFPFVKKK